jgi:hypothetical protein
VSIILTIIALALWSYSIPQAKLDIGSFGLISGYPVTFFIALVILTIASAILWMSKENHSWLLLLQLCLLIASISLMPILVKGSQPFLQESFYDLGRIDYIARTGHFSPVALWETNWPAPLTYWAVVLKITGASIDGFAGIIRLIPVVWHFIVMIPLFVFFRNTIGQTKPNYVWAAMWLFCIGWWSEILDTGSHSFGIFVIFCLMAVFTMPSLLESKKLTFTYSVVCIVLLAVLVTSHFLGSLVGLALIAALYFSRRFSSYKLLVVVAVLICAWSMYGADWWFGSHLTGMIGQGFNVGEAASEGLANPFFGNQAHTAVVVVRLLLSALLVIITLIGLFLARKQQNTRYADITVIAIAIGFIIVSFAVAGGYANIVFQRFLLFLMPLMAYFGVKLLRLKFSAVILCILLIIALPMTFISIYGNQRNDYLSPAYLKSATFFQDKVSSGYVTALMPFGQMKNIEQYPIFPTYEQLTWKDNELEETILRLRHYILISNHDRETYDYLYNKPQFITNINDSMETATNCNLVFENGDATLYLYEKPGVTP